MKRPRFGVIVGSDATTEARAAVVATTTFPWPAGTEVTGVVARRTREVRGRPGYVRTAFDRVYAQAALTTRRALERRWPGASVILIDQSPAEAILAEARRRRARVIVLGSRQRGWIARHLLGSVSAAVVRHASCTVLVVRGRPRAFDRIVIGVDGSPQARRAVEFVKRLPRHGAGVVTLVSAVEPTRTPSVPFMPQDARMTLVREATRLNAGVEKHARAALRRYQRELSRAGWKVRSAIVRARPVQGLLATAASARARLLVVGARGVGGIERLLLGSVAEGVLDRAPISVLIVR